VQTKKPTVSVSGVANVAVGKRDLGDRCMDNNELKTLMDRQEISFLLHEYCRTLDAMDLDTLAEIFTEDCIVEYGPEDRLKSHGKAAIRQGLERLWRWKRTSHHLSNIQIRFGQADEANALSYVIAWHERPDGSTGTIWGQYHDMFVRTPVGWRLKRRRQTMNGNDAGFTVNVFSSERRQAPAGWVAPVIDRVAPVR
jgi:ketosteroid isomerase-like protein